MSELRLAREQIAANDVAFAVMDQGQRPGVVLLRGFPDSADLWRNPAAALAEAGFRMVVPDLRGIGASDRPGRSTPRRSRRPHA
jgi:epoxide hydrolase 4